MCDIVLSQDLLTSFFKFYYLKDYKSDNIINFFKMFKPFCVTVDQLKSVIENDTAIRSIIATRGPWSIRSLQTKYDSPFDEEALSELVDSSKFKILLTRYNEKHVFRSISINENNVDRMAFVSTLKAGSNRDALREYVRKLICSANTSICIFDRYIFKEDPNDLCFYLNECKCVNISILTGDDADCLDRSELKNRIVELCPNLVNQLTVKSYPRYTLHDRYIIIDNGLEIILTSGFHFLHDKTKDITCIVREC